MNIGSISSAISKVRNEYWNFHELSFSINFKEIFLNLIGLVILRNLLKLSYTENKVSYVNIIDIACVQIHLSHCL